MNSPHPTPCALIVMGVSGSGKSTIGKQLAARLGWAYEDGDRFHPAGNVAKMSAGQPLTDEDRWPWLKAIADEIDRLCAAGERAVVACSALRRIYRDILVHGRNDILIVYLEGQFKTLEPPTSDEHPLTVSIDAPVETIVDDIVGRLKSGPAALPLPHRNST